MHALSVTGGAIVVLAAACSSAVFVRAGVCVVAGRVVASVRLLCP